jgi:hypothetical protein
MTALSPAADFLRHGRAFPGEQKPVLFWTVEEMQGRSVLDEAIAGSGRVSSDFS